MAYFTREKTALKKKTGNAAMWSNILAAVTASAGRAVLRSGFDWTTWQRGFFISVPPSPNEAPAGSTTVLSSVERRARTFPGH